MISDTVYSFIFDPCFVRTLNSPRRSEKYKLFLINSEYLKIVLNSFNMKFTQTRRRGNKTEANISLYIVYEKL